MEASRLGWDRGGGRAGKAYDHFMTEKSHKPRETLTPRRTRVKLHMQTAVSSRQPGQTEAVCSCLRATCASQSEDRPQACTSGTVAVECCSPGGDFGSHLRICRPVAKPSAVPTPAPRAETAPMPKYTRGIIIRAIVVGGINGVNARKDARLKESSAPSLVLWSLVCN